MKLPTELVLARKIREQKRTIRKLRTCKKITGVYCEAQRPRMARELVEIAARTR